MRLGDNMRTSKLVKALKNDTFTENGAVSYKSTLDSNLDFYYHASAKRGLKDEVLGLFVNAFAEDEKLAIKSLFYLRDVRGGSGERDLFRHCLNHIHRCKPNLFDKLVPFIPYFGRWDDLLVYFDQSVIIHVVNTLNEDLNSDYPSLLAKWLPSANTSSKETVKLGKQWAKYLGLSEKGYRHLLSKLRAKINIVEQKMSAGNWDIDYESVPSKAHLIYRNAFKKHNPEKYAQYLASVEKGEKKINSSVLYPYELVRGYIDETKELQWKALPNYFEDSDENILVMCDVSGSMESGNSGVVPMDVSVSLAIYAAERNQGLFHNAFITFTDVPKLVYLEGETLLDKIRETKEDVGYNTNIQAAFDLVLKTALKHNLSQEEMPTKIFVISDMEFDSCGPSTNFELVKRKYEQSGYVMPTLVFWNVASRNLQTPVTQNEKGVYLVSGCSPVVFKNALNCKATTPYEQMLDVLNGERYSILDQVL